MGDDSIRLLGKEDIPAVHDLWRAAGLPFFEKGRDAVQVMAREMDHPGTFLAGIEDGNHLAAVVLGTDDGRKAWINRLAVRPSHRGRGLARKLIHFCEKQFAERGIGIISALIEEDNAPSLSLFLDESYELHRDIHYLRKKVNGPGW
ncbi:MAG: GNAT family N-acetyltransferase [Acidobacteriota bacterium]